MTFLGLGLDQRGDPVPAFNFLITLSESPGDGLEAGLSMVSSALGADPSGGFQECTGLEGTLQLEEYEEGGRNGEVLKFPKRMSWGNITLKRGLALATDLWDWHYGFVTGRGRRRDGMIVVQDSRRLPSSVWYFRRGLPVRWQGPSLNAQRSEVAIETIEIAHEGLSQVPGVGLGIAAVDSVVAAVESVGDLF